jgi:hypothetical protein
MSRKIPARSTINAIIAAIFPNFQRFDRPDEGKCDGSMVSTVMRGRGGPLLKRISHNVSLRRDSYQNNRKTVSIVIQVATGRRAASFAGTNCHPRTARTAFSSKPSPIPRVT